MAFDPFLGPDWASGQITSDQLADVFAGAALGQISAGMGRPGGGRLRIDAPPDEVAARIKSVCPEGGAKCFVAGTQVVMCEFEAAAVDEGFGTFIWRNRYIFAAVALAAAGPTGYLILSARQRKRPVADPANPADWDVECSDEPIWVPLLPASWLAERAARLRVWREFATLALRGRYELELLEIR